MALIGPSGCGKTSFLTCLNRLVERERGCKVSGRILLGNQDVQALISPASSGECSFKTQPVSALHYQKYRISPEHGIRSRDEIDHRVEDVLRDVGLWMK